MPNRPPRICPTCQRAVAADRMCMCARKRRVEHDRKRPTARERGYSTAWDKARRDFLASHPRCAHCGGLATVVNHIVPHKGDQGLFWKRSNWEAVCAPCHNGPIQSAERREGYHS